MNKNHRTLNLLLVLIAVALVANAATTTANFAPNTFVKMAANHQVNNQGNTNQVATITTGATTHALCNGNAAANSTTSNIAGVTNANARVPEVTARNGVINLAANNAVK